MLFAPKEKGQGLVEYALILVLVAVVVIAVLLILGPIIGNVFTKINSSLAAHQVDLRANWDSENTESQFLFSYKL